MAYRNLAEEIVMMTVPQENQVDRYSWMMTSYVLVEMVEVVEKAEMVWKVLQTIAMKVN